MSALQRIERELTRSQRRAVAEGDSVEITGTPGLAENCEACGHWIVYWLDPEGLWAECGCDGGYIR